MCEETIPRLGRDTNEKMKIKLKITQELKQCSPAPVMLGGPHESTEWQGMGCQAEDEQCLCTLVPSLPLSSLPATSAIGVSENRVHVPCLLPALVTLLRFPPVPEPDEQCGFQVSLQLRP